VSLLDRLSDEPNNSFAVHPDLIRFTDSKTNRGIIMSLGLQSIRRPFLAFGVTMLGLCVLLAASWPQWRGPKRDGISTEDGLLQQWPAEGPKLLWQLTDIGDGYSTPAVVGNRIYLLSNEGMDNEFVQALDVDDGQQIWEQRIGNVGLPDQEPKYPGSRSTPTIDGELMYALGSDGDLACLESGTGRIRWQKNVRNEFGGKYGQWAYAESPLVDGEVVVCTPGGEEATLVALNKLTGELVRKFPVPGGEEAGYASIVIANIGGVKQYVQFLENGLVGVDAQTGKFLWRYDHTAKGSPANIPTPIVRGNLVYSASGRGGGGLVEITANGGVFEAKELYFGGKYPRGIGGAVLVGDYMYGTSGLTMVCVEFETGEVVWSKDRAVAPASLCFADGSLYLHGENVGEMALVEASPAEYRERGRFMPANLLPERDRTDAYAYPVVADGRLYIRDHGRLWCYEVKSQSGASARP
jgi:outer membrane protein assembly factor BamB